MSWNNQYQRGYQNQNFFQITIRKFPPTTPYPEVIQFLNSATANARWRKIKYADHTGVCVLQFDTEEDMNVFLALRGTTYKDSILNIETGSTAPQQPAYQTYTSSTRSFRNPLNLGQKNQLQEAVAKCWDANGGLLALGGFIPNPNPNEEWLTFSNMKFTESLIDIFETHCRTVTALDLSGNNISTLEGFRDLRRGCPQLECLCLMNNPISDFREFNHLQAYRNQLKEIKLCSEILIKTLGHPLLYQEELLARFPNLKLIDGNPVTPPMAFSIDIPQSLLPEPHSSSIPDQFTQLLQSFLQGFFNAIDQDRNSLSEFYNQQSMFSFTANADQQKDANRGQMPNGYTKHNRNLQQSKIAEKRNLKTMYIGANNIVKFYKDLPATQHQAEYLVVDASAVPSADLLQISLSGYYAEAQQGARPTVFRKFHRFMTLASDSSAKYQVSILNDELNVGDCVTPDKADMPGSERYQQQDVINKLSAHCGCTADIAHQALQQSGNDPHKALKLIQNLQK